MKKKKKIKIIIIVTSIVLLLSIFISGIVMSERLDIETFVIDKIQYRLN